ncbi:hypothetical protein GGI04_003563 [Coemansia thaxteri]|uniref:Mitochondrial carrier n=1 Tax=Coemansia thaxteri TaxID=2663907 RepID=A0A9W8EGM5_9FUNG|nr:hypothetical protein H4R26_004565 [Coemansia thaxteri]KAJ2001899.1 hypothetical protein GGI04_003563 [Coemansia thaxteri]KAJ2470173.1 hypothetical protein GGI02_003104 [Coemansia sp. RSA 2322]KAJ2479101.1 hypothetical protein EV174_004117 [Coemansia sp. RSA 2320]
MSDSSDFYQAQGSSFRPYADSATGNATGSSGIYDDLRNPLESLRNAARDGQLSDNAFELSRLSSDTSGLHFEGLGANELGYADSVDTTQAATELVKFAGYRFLATLAACPFSISQTLLQVQYLPTAAKFSEASEALHKQSSSGDLNDADDENTPDPDSPDYYEYLRARHSGRNAQQNVLSTRARVNHSGYIVSVQDRAASDIRPGYQLEALPDAKLAVLRRLVTHPTEGVLSMFKGAFSQWVYDMLHLLLQPTLEGILNEMFGLYDGAPVSTYIDASAPSALTLIASSAIVGWLLSPLELVRTRLMVQSASPIHRKYRGVFHALKTVAREEGGLTALYLSPYHVVPTLVKHTLDTVFRNMGSFALDRVAGVDPYDHPTTFALGGLFWKTMSALVMLPIDTVRTRLQVQPRYTNKAASGSAHLSSTGSRGKHSDGFVEYRTCVPISPIPYTGMVNCAWRIITEEGVSLKQIKRRRAAEMAVAMSGEKERARPASNVGYYGLRGLYPGISLQLMANVAIFGLSFVSVDEMEDAF